MKRSTRSKHTAAMLFAASALVLAGTAAAQYTGPSEQAVLGSVAAVLAEGKDDAPVEIEGRLVSRIDDETYRFSDGEGEIRVEIDTEDMPTQAIDETMWVRLRGEVDTATFGDPEVEVDTVTVIDPS